MQILAMCIGGGNGVFTFSQTNSSHCERMVQPLGANIISPCASSNSNHFRIRCPPVFLSNIIVIIIPVLSRYNKCMRDDVRVLRATRR